jgi:hypothetical protein
MATLRTAALNLLRLAGFLSIGAGMQAVMRDITTLLAMALRQPRPEPDLYFESALGFGRLDQILQYPVRCIR